MSESLTRSDPADSQARRDLSVYYNKLGDLAQLAGDSSKALDYYQKDLGVSLALAESDSNDSQARRDLSISYDRLGNVSLKAGEMTKALDYYQKGLGVREKLASADPNDVQARRDLSLSYNKVGDVFSRTGETARAIEYFQKGLGVVEAWPDPTRTTPGPARPLDLVREPRRSVTEDRREGQGARILHAQSRAFRQVVPGRPDQRRGSTRPGNLLTQPAVERDPPGG